MNIYLVKNDTFTWDQYDGFVVAAESPKEAKRMIDGNTSDYAWNQEGKITCSKIGRAEEKVKPGILLSSYNAG